MFRTKLVVSKGKLINVDQSTSIPRLELCAAVLLDKLATKVRKSFPYILKENIILNTDSLVALHWIHLKDPFSLKPFCFNRVIQIQKSGYTWKFCASMDNPADFCTKLHPAEAYLKTVFYLVEWPKVLRNKSIFPKSALVQ